MIARRSFLTGLASLIAAPAVVRAASLMSMRGIVVPQFSLRRITEYYVTSIASRRLDIAYGKMAIRPEWVVVVSDLCDRTGIRRVDDIVGSLRVGDAITVSV